MSPVPARSASGRPGVVEQDDRAPAGHLGNGGVGDGPGSGPAPVAGVLVDEGQKVPLLAEVPGDGPGRAVQRAGGRGVRHPHQRAVDAGGPGEGELGERQLPVDRVRRLRGQVGVGEGVHPDLVSRADEVPHEVGVAGGLPSGDEEGAGYVVAVEDLADPGRPRGVGSVVEGQNDRPGRGPVGARRLVARVDDRSPARDVPGTPAPLRPARSPRPSWSPAKPREVYPSTARTETTKASRTSGTTTRNQRRRGPVPRAADRPGGAVAPASGSRRPAGRRAGRCRGSRTAPRAWAAASPAARTGCPYRARTARRCRAAEPPSHRRRRARTAHRRPDPADPRAHPAARRRRAPRGVRPSVTSPPPASGGSTGTPATLPGPAPGGSSSEPAGSSRR